jgi:cytochrome P450
MAIPPRSRVPGPRLPVAVQTALFGLRPVPFMTWCHRRNGDVFRIRLVGGETVVVLADPVDIKAVFSLDAEGFSAAGNAPMLEPFLGPRSLLLLDGRSHRRHRRLMVRSLHGDAMTTYRDVIVEATLRDMAMWPTGRPFALHPHLQAITLDVIMRLVFGIDDGDALEELRVVLRRWLAQAGSFLVLMPPLRRELGGLSPWAQFMRKRGKVHELLVDHIARRRLEPGLAERHDVLSLLLEGRDEAGNGLSDEELLDELVTMLAAGHDTTATALAWAFDLLLHEPAVLERLRDDLTAGEGRYLDATIKEVMRLRPVVPDVGRRLTEPLELTSYTLPAGITASPSILLAQRRAESYPDPAAFRPERFLDGRPDPLRWLPFGGGIRRCIGAGLATLEIEVVLRTVLAGADLRPARRRLERPRRRAVTLTPSRGTRVMAAQVAPA